MRRATAVEALAWFAAALAPRLVACRSLDLTVGEATAAHRTWLELAPSVPAARALAAVLAAAAVPLVFALARANGGRAAARFAAAFCALDPLSCLAGREAGPGGALALLGALLLAALEPRLARGFRIGAAAAALLCGALALPGAPALVQALPLDPAFLAWRELGSAVAAGALAVVHQLGYALVPLGLGGIALSCRGRGLLALGAALGLAVAAEAGSPHRLVAFAALSPPLALAAGRLLGAVAERECRTARWPTGAFGLFALALAVNAPVLASDLRSAQRFPWQRAFASLDAGERASLPLYSSAPAPLAAIAGRAVQPLPQDGPTLARLLAGQAPLALFVALEGNLPYGALDEAALAAIEATTYPASTSAVSRFDLLRLGIRVYRLGPAER